jgi:hypothetical protein
MSVDLVKHVPKAMQEVADHEHNWKSNAYKAQNGKRNHASGFEHGTIVAYSP